MVQIQYRLGPFGFLALPELVQESGTAGLNGILDQQLALRWIHNNIEYFGGDKNRVSLSMLVENLTTTHLRKVPSL